MIWILFSFLMFNSPALEVPQQAEPAKIKFEQDTLYLGNIKAGDKVPLLFKFKNIGTTPYQIKFINPSCSCTEAQFPKGWVEAGKEAEIKGVFNSTSKSGEYQGSIVLHGNTDPHYHVLVFKATIE